MKKYLLLSSTLALACLSFSNLTAQNYFLSLSGNYNYVNCGSDAALDANKIKTMESWINFASFSGSQEIMSRSTGGSGIELLLYAGNLSFFCMNSALGATSHVDYPLTNLETGIWYHIAATWDGSKESMRLYINGKSVGTRLDDGNINTVGVSQPTGSFMIGQWSQTTENRFFNGSLDEIRVWNVNRSADQIKLGMLANYSSGASGLTAYYPINELTASSVPNATSTPNLNGTISGPGSRTTSPIRFASNCLNFDGSDDQVIIPANSLFDLTTGTVECWLRPTALSTNLQACFIGNRFTDTRFSFHIASNQIGLFNGVYGYKVMPYTFLNNNWYHVAFVFTNTGTDVYINGTFINTVDFKPSTVTGQKITLGITKNGSGADMEPYTGDIDDVRFWSTMRTQQEINSNKNTALTGTETGLIANYTFNTGNSSSLNNGLKTALDATPNNLHGTLTNFTLTGATSNYVSSAVVILPIQLTSFSATRSGMTSLLTWVTAQEQGSKNFVVESSTDGKSFTTIGTVIAASNSTAATPYSFTDYKPLPGTNYYRLQLADADGKTSYSKTVAVKFPATAVISISPNPASSSLSYTVSSLQATKAIVTIVSATGQKVITTIAAVQAGNNNLSIDVSRLPAGNYTLQVLNTPAGVASNQHFTIAR